MQAIVAGAEVPVEDGKVNEMPVGYHKSAFGIGNAQNPAVEIGAFEPFLKRLADGLFVVNDENRFRPIEGYGHAVDPDVGCASPSPLYHGSVGMKTEARQLAH
jgi:hypothetical protein